MYEGQGATEQRVGVGGKNMSRLSNDFEVVYVVHVIDSSFDKLT